MSYSDEPVLAVAAEPYRLWNVGEVFDLPKPEWLMDYVIPKGGSTLLYGPTNVGKSLLALDWAFRLASGWKWLGQRVPKPVNVLYAYAEGGHDLQLRYQAWAEGNNVNNFEFLENNIAFIGLDEEVLLRWDPNNVDQEPPGVARLYAAADVFKPDVVVFDPAQEVWRGMDSNSDQHVQMAYKVIKELQRRHGCSALIVHHARKDGDTFRGATTWADLADVAFAISETQVGGLVDLRNTKTRYAEKGFHWKLERRVITIEKIPDLWGEESVYMASGRRFEETSQRDRLLGLLSLNDMTYSEIGDALFRDKRSSKTAGVIASMEADGLIYKEEGRLGRYKLTTHNAERPEDI